ncbi:MAG: cysteine desulfurase [Erysipelotrichaceae bacterium]|nr:cysteine desulfurase [Erysipelotrichaceae bacterium]MDY6034080.1 cysteine desulfurase [Bulleidia sp.]
MIDVYKIRQDFPMIVNHPNLIYFDNGATTYKPKAVIDAICGFYTNFTSNVERGDYETAIQADRAYDHTREVVARFIHCQPKEVVFTANITASLNQVAYGLGKGWLKKGDVVLTTLNEHASNLLPWYRLEKEIGIKLAYIPVDNHGVVDMQAYRDLLSSDVKVVTLAETTNVLGALQPIKEMTKLAHEVGALMVVDGAQSVPHHVTDVMDSDVDFLGFSSHKMCGPDGVGVLYGKYALLDKMEPLLLGGGMNARFSSDGEVTLKNAPIKFEAGTPNIEGVIGLAAACEYLMSIGMENISAYEKELRAYFASKLKELDNIDFYNPENVSGPITFNAKGVFAQDAAGYLGANHIAVRSGNHCAKVLHEVIGTDQTIRASLYFYNTKEEVDRFIEVAKKISLENAVGIFF